MRTGARVERVHRPRGGRVTGVGVAGGERVAADVVIADVMPHALARMAGDALPRLVPARCCAATATAPATVKVDWALDGPIPWANAGGRAAPGTVHVGGGEDELLAHDRAGRTTACPTRPFLLLGQQSVADPTRAPAGKHTAWAYTHGPQRRRRLGGRARPPRRAHGGAGRALRARLPRPHPRPPRARPRPTSRRRNANLVGGDVGGGSYRLDQVVFRPMPSLSPYRTPLRRPVPRQRRDVPRRRGPRRARRRGRARRRWRVWVVVVSRWFRGGGVRGRSGRVRRGWRV